jgi:hypothetical protein
VVKDVADPRHHPLLCEIDKQYRASNGGLPIPSPGRAAKALLEFLGENPKWPLDTLMACVRNRFASRGLNLALPPHAWVKTLPQYAAGPLDDWGKPLQKAESRKQKAADAEEMIADYWAAKRRASGLAG